MSDILGYFESTFGELFEKIGLLLTPSSGHTVKVKTWDDAREIIRLGEILGDTGCENFSSVDRNKKSEIKKFRFFSAKVSR